MEWCAKAVNLVIYVGTMGPPANNKSNETAIEDDQSENAGFKPDKQEDSDDNGELVDGCKVPADS